MADFALWASACEPALWSAGTFWAAYTGNCDHAVETVIDADPVAAAVRRFMESQTEWNGTASNLLGALASQEGERATRSRSWPSSPQALSGRLRRAATFLRGTGIDVDLGQRKGHGRIRTIRITTRSPSPESEIGSEISSASSAIAENVRASDRSAHPVERPRSAFADAGIVRRSIRTRSLNGMADDADDADDNLIPF
jgi:hypothetical protein